jgi:hypothetical protein
VADARTREPNSSSKKPESPALVTRRNCPNCGRERAIVFRQIRDYDESVKGAPLVCLDCCTEVRDPRLAGGGTRPTTAHREKETRLGARPKESI